MKRISGNLKLKAEGKNKFSIKSGNTSNCTKVINGDSITLTSTLVNGGFSVYAYEFEVKPNTTYYVQSKSTRTGNGGGGIVIQAKKGDTAIKEIFNKKHILNAEGSFTTTADTETIKVYLYACDDGGGETTYSSATYTEVQIEKGNKTAYVPHIEPKIISIPLGEMELCSTPEGIRDNLIRVDGAWNKKNNILSFPLPTNLSVGNAMNDLGFIQYSAKILTQKSNSIKVMSNRFGTSNKFIANANVTKEMIYSRAPEYPDYLYICIKAERLDGATYDLTTTSGRNLALNKWLEANPTEVIYPLAESTCTPITDQALINALDELEELILHQGYNYITATAANGVRAHLDLSYYKDINIVLDNINASILSLGGGASV